MIPRRALIVGIDHYQLPGNDLQAAVADAQAVEALLKKHEDDTPNYDCRLLCDTLENGQPITRPALRKACQELFSDFRGDVLFYFSGHGVFSANGAYLATFDAEEDDWGLPMQEIAGLALESNANDIVFILDCCHSGAMGNPPVVNGRADAFPLSVMRENMTVIAASRPLQSAIEDGGHGRFTALVLDALKGGAADHLGWVTASSIYAHVERRFNAWEQRPVYKSHATSVNVIRQCAPLIERLKLHQLVQYFPTPDHCYPLDPEFEPEDEHGNLHEPVNHQKVAIAQLFKEYRDAGLLKPSVTGEQLYWTARRSHTVQLTLRGREYWMLVANEKI